VKVEELIDVINEDRAVAGFPEIIDISAVEEEVEKRKHYYKDVIKSALYNLSPEDIVDMLTEVVKESGEADDTVFPYVLSEIIEIYRIKAQPFFEKETENVRKLVQVIKEGLEANRPDSAVREKVDQLVQVMRNWNKVAKPMILRAKIMGTDYDEAWDFMILFRDLALFFNNEYGKIDFALRLTRSLMGEFSDLEKISKTLANDAKMLLQLKEERIR